MSVPGSHPPNTPELGYVDGYVPPLPIGTRVIATAESELAPAGSLGTITWHHPLPVMPYRVRWDFDVESRWSFGMDDIGFLTKPVEIVAVENGGV